MTAVPTALDVEGPAAPPRSNGELVFSEPWESRAFGLALTLHDRGAFDWETFRQELIASVAAWERDHPGPGGQAPDGPAECYSYYRCWLTALERVLTADGVVTPGEVDRRAAELAARPPGHDHEH